MADEAYGDIVSPDTLKYLIIGFTKDEQLGPLP